MVSAIDVTEPLVEGLLTLENGVKMFDAFTQKDVLVTAPVICCFCDNVRASELLNPSWEQSGKVMSSLSIHIILSCTSVILALSCLDFFISNLHKWWNENSNSLQDRTMKWSNVSRQNLARDWNRLSMVWRKKIILFLNWNQLISLGTNLFGYNILSLHECVYRYTGQCQLNVYTQFFWEHINTCCSHLWTRHLTILKKKYWLSSAVFLSEEFLPI